MKYDPILCMMVDDTVKTRDAGGFAPGSKAKIVVENEGTQYETYAVEYGGQPLKRGFKTREAAKNYAKSQGLTTDSSIDEAVRSCDVGRGYDQLKRESKLLLGHAKEIATKLNKLNDDCRALRESERSDGSLSSEQRKEIEKLITEAFNYVGNNTEI